MQGAEMEDEGSVLKYMTKSEIEEQRSSLLIMTQRLFFVNVIHRFFLSTDETDFTVFAYTPNGALPLFIGGGDHVVVRGKDVLQGNRFICLITLINNEATSKPLIQVLSQTPSATKVARPPNFGGHFELVSSFKFPIEHNKRWNVSQNPPRS